MQTSGLGATIDAEVEKVIGSSQREFVVEVKVDWLRTGLFTNHPFSDLSPYVNSVTVDRALSGTAPTDIMLVQGAAAAEMTLELGGDYIHPSGARLPLTGVFSPYNGLSPLYLLDPVGCEITYRLGVETFYGTIWYSQFVGNVRNITPTRDTNTVEITALDRAEVMRQPVNLPVWALQAWQANRGYTQAQLAYSTWVLDQCLKMGNVSTSPNRPPTPQELYTSTADHKYGVQLWVSGNGSYIPNIGTLDNSRIQGFPDSASGGIKMYSEYGESHPLVKTETEANGTRPLALMGTMNDASGIVPAQIDQSPFTSDTTANRAYHLGYRAARHEDLLTDKGGSHWFGFTLLTRGMGTWWQTATDILLMEVYSGWNKVLRIRLTSGQVRAECYDWSAGVTEFTTPWVTIPTGLNSVPIEAKFEQPASASSTARKAGIRAGANFSTFASYAANTRGLPDDNREGVVNVNHRVSMQDIWWTNFFWVSGVLTDAEFVANGRRPAKYAAVMDLGKNMFSMTPQTQYEDGWSLAADVASAEFGSIQWDETGVFRFWNRDTMLNKQATTVKTVTLDEAEDLRVTNSLDSVRNVITLDVIVATADQDVVLEVSDPEQFYMAPGSNVNTTVDISDTTIQAVTPGKVQRYATNPDTYVTRQWSDSVQHGYVVEFWYAAPGSPATWHENNTYISGVDVFAAADGHGNMTLRFHNGYNAPARFSHLRISGTKVTKESNSVETFSDKTSIDKYNPRNWQVSGDWVQAQYDATVKLGDFLLARTKTSIPTTDDIVIPGDPRLQLGDCLEIQDPAGFGESIKVQTLGINRSYDKESGLTDRLTVEMIQPPRVGVWDSPTYGIWGASFIWDD